VFSPTSDSGAGFDRDHNQLYAVAQRSYLLGFDPCPVGVVTVPGEPPGQVGQ
jgi:hypothetical protein